MSRSVSVNLLEATGKIISMKNLPSSIRIIIPRDTNLLLPVMAYQNVTGMNTSSNITANNNRQFALYYVNITTANENLTISATFELKPENASLGYMIIFRFDAIPILNSTVNQINDFKIFCPSGYFLLFHHDFLFHLLM